VVAGLLATAVGSVIDDVIAVVRPLSPDARYSIQSSLTTLSLMGAHSGMPNPAPIRSLVKRLLDRLERS
jgi:hypothetical protein